MSLPKKPAFPSFVKNAKLRDLILPVTVVVFLTAVLFVGVIIPQQNKKSTEKTKDVSVFTKPNTVKLDGGRELEIAGRVKQISPEELKAALSSKDQLTLIEVFSGDEWKQPKIAGSILMNKASFDTVPAEISRTSYNVYVSADGYDSAEAISKLLSFGFSYDNNVNLDGGLKAWKDKGYALQP